MGIKTFGEGAKNSQGGSSNESLESLKYHIKLKRTPIFARLSLDFK